MHDYNLKCKKHVDFDINHKIFTYVCLTIGMALLTYTVIIQSPLAIYAGWWIFGIVGIGWAIFDLPQILWHQVTCKDTPHWQAVEKWQKKTYKPVNYQQWLERQEQETITQENIKQQTLR